MADFWITTHWPTPDCKPGPSRYVYFKKNKVTLPKPGDFIFIRETREAKVNGKLVKTVVRHYRGEKTTFQLPKGTGGIVGTAQVAGPARKQNSEDVVFDFGNLDEWCVVHALIFSRELFQLTNSKAFLRRRLAYS